LARKKGTYDSVQKAKAEEAIRMNMKVGLVINIEESEDASQTSTNITPVTMKSLSSSSNATSTSASTATSSAEGRRSRKSSRQASVAKLEAKRLKVDYILQGGNFSRGIMHK
jgi:guanyl-specific ribonuclease Sa